MSAAFQVDTLTTLLDATRRLASVQDETSVIKTIADSALTVFEAPGAALFIGGADTVAACGLGLGLPLVRVVEQHGGTVTAHSAGAGQGSVFIVRLPSPAL